MTSIIAQKWVIVVFLETNILKSYLIIYFRTMFGIISSAHGLFDEMMNDDSIYVNIYNISKYSVCNWFICFNFPWNLKPLCFVQWKYIWYVENITKTFIFFHIILLWYFNSNSISGFKISLFELEVKIQHLLLCHMKFEKKLNEMFIYRWICSMIQK